MRHEADYDAQPNRPPYRDAPPKRRTYMVTDLGQRVAKLEDRVKKLECPTDKDPYRRANQEAVWQ